MEMTSYKPGTPSWVDIGLPDMDAAIAFYGGLFGWDIEPGPPEAGGYAMCLLRGRPVAGIGPQMNPEIPPYWASYVTVADVAATVAAATAAGGSVLVPTMEVMSAGVMAIVADPTGGIISLWQPIDHIGAHIVNEPGTFCWNELMTDDVAAATAFYTGLFGWEAAVHDNGGEHYTEFLLDGRSTAGMMAKPAGVPAEMPSMWTVYFTVEDCDAAVAKVQELGGAPIMPAMDIPQGRFAPVADPFGAVFNVMALAEGMGT